jgi:hypothetical protein
MAAAHEPIPVIVTVAGSHSDFDEYQLPASPKYFVGRKRLVEALGHALDARAGVLVLNAKSGWGKSSAALRLKALTTAGGPGRRSPRHVLGYLP